jgi:dihydrofolate synthase / folylpolyglutamate synthase
MQLLKQLYNLRSSVKYDLNKVRSARKKLGCPDKKYRCIHVAGTNGKGSVVCKVAHVLQKNGYKVGVFTSPHISSICERIRINDAKISYSDLERIFKIVETMDLSFFETITLIAFLYFAEQNIDYAVIEVGLGGRLDSTNIIKPVVSVITSIGLDHCDILGDSLEDIAREKGGIIKEGVPYVLGPTVQPFISGGVCVNGDFEDYDEENSAIACAVLEALGEVGDVNTRPSCRFEEVGNVILDVAHNPIALEALFVKVKRKYSDFVVVAGLSCGKDIESCRKIILKHDKKACFVHNEHERIVQSEDTQDLFEVLPRLLKLGCRVVVCGSFFIMSDVRKILGLVDQRDLFDINERKG